MKVVWVQYWAIALDQYNRFRRLCNVVLYTIRVHTTLYSQCWNHVLSLAATPPQHPPSPTHCHTHTHTHAHYGYCGGRKIATPLA